MARYRLANYPTAELAHLKINSLLTKLGRAPLADSEMIAFMDDYLAKIEELEDELDAKGTAAAPTSPPAKPKSAPPAKASSQAEPEKPATELRGIQRAAHAQRTGNTAKPADPPSALPTTGYGRAARAQQAINNRKNKS